MAYKVAQCREPCNARDSLQGTRDNSQLTGQGSVGSLIIQETAYKVAQQKRRHGARHGITDGMRDRVQVEGV